MKANIDFTNLTMIEYFNATADPWMMNNLHTASSPAIGVAPFDALHAELAKWFKCVGDACP
jgi:hypothetical protein|tara:strand:+ start:407 stop:589 length:183 start_codon:yes stop_codon:yes gene_type:complete